MLSKDPGSPQSFHPILEYWFGRVEETIVPSEHRARIWFGENPEVDHEIKTRFRDTHQQAVSGRLSPWLENAHGRLGLVIIYDQFSRHIYRNQAEAYACDAQALIVCSDGIQGASDHELSLIERVFYYLPLMHSESLQYQELSMRCYGMLVDLALPETKMVYDSFYRFAQHHYAIIQKFGRFPQRNKLLARESTDLERIYLEQESLR